METEILKKKNTGIAFVLYGLMFFCIACILLFLPLPIPQTTADLSGILAIIFAVLMIIIAIVLLHRGTQKKQMD